MKILITNDDGYDHLGHRSLKKILQELDHEVWSVAPQQNQSGVGMKMTMDQDLECKPLDQRSWACSGTPVDCVLFAIHGLLPIRPDAMISGINGGSNLSDDLWYSGTAAAAREASKWGLPALALSYSCPPPYCEADFSDFAGLLGAHLEDLLRACELQQLSGATKVSGHKHGIGAGFTGFLNINIPADCNGKIQFVSRFEPRPYLNHLEQISEHRYALRGEIDKDSCLRPVSLSGVDTAADGLSQISISLGSFHALQPLPYQSALQSMRSGPLRLGPSERAEQAVRRIVQAAGQAGQVGMG